jgi:hypothetical protein
MGGGPSQRLTPAKRVSAGHRLATTLIERAHKP